MAGVQVIAPGPISGTEGMARLANGDQHDVIRKSTPLQRLGEPHEIADATVFLFSEAGSFITGDVVVVDGGSWHRQGTVGPYPEMLLGGHVVQGVRGTKSSKL